MAPATLPILLASDRPPPPLDLDSLHRLPEIRAAAKRWSGKDTSKFDRDECIAAIKKADDSAARKIVRDLSNDELQILRVYRRYGNQLDGTVARAELLHRGLIEIILRGDPSYPWASWKKQPLNSLKARLFLYTSGERRHLDYSYGPETNRPFPHSFLNPSLAPFIDPADSPDSLLKPLTNAVTASGGASVTMLVMDLSRMVSVLTAKRSVKLNKSRELSNPALRTLSKEFVQGEEELAPPDRAGFLFELLRELGLLTEQNDVASPNTKAAAIFFQSDESLIAHRLGKAWLSLNHWRDGVGMGRQYYGYDDNHNRTGNSLPGP